MSESSAKNNNAAPELRLVDVSLIDDPEMAMRQDFDAEALEELTASIQQNGVIEPLVLRERGTRFEVIAGHRRLLAASRCRLAQVPAVVRNASDSETAVLRLHENLLREDVDAVSEGIYLANVIRSQGLDVERVCSIIQKSRQYVDDRLVIADMPDYMQQAIRDKRIALGVALELVKVEDETYRRQWTDAAISQGMSVRAARDAVRQWLGIKAMREVAAPGADVPELPQTPPVILYPCARCGENEVLEALQIVRIHRRPCGSE